MFVDLFKGIEQKNIAWEELNVQIGENRGLSYKLPNNFVQDLWASLFKFGCELCIALKKIDDFLNTFYPCLGYKETLSLYGGVEVFDLMVNLARKKQYDFLWSISTVGYHLEQGEIPSHFMG